MMDCLCGRDRPLNFSQAMALCRSLHCGASRHLSNTSSNSLAPLGRLPPSRGRSFLVPVSDTLPLNPNDDCAPVPFWPAPILPACQLCRLPWSRSTAALGPEMVRDSRPVPAYGSWMTPPTRKARHPGLLPLISRLWPESTKQLVPCRLAGTPVAAYDALLGTLNLTLPSAGEPLAFGPRRRMTRGFEEDRCSPLGAVALLYPPPRCRRPSQAVQIRSAVELSLVAEELR